MCNKKETENKTKAKNIASNPTQKKKERRMNIIYINFSNNSTD